MYSRGDGSFVCVAGFRVWTDDEACEDLERTSASMTKHCVSKLTIHERIFRTVIGTQSGGDASADHMILYTSMWTSWLESLSLCDPSSFVTKIQISSSPRTIRKKTKIHFIQYGSDDKRTTITCIKVVIRISNLAELHAYYNCTLSLYADVTQRPVQSRNTSIIISHIFIMRGSRVT